MKTKLEDASRTLLLSRTLSGLCRRAGRQGVSCQSHSSRASFCQLWKTMVLDTTKAHTSGFRTSDRWTRNRVNEARIHNHSQVTRYSCTQYEFLFYSFHHWHAKITINFSIKIQVTSTIISCHRSDRGTYILWLAEDFREGPEEGCHHLPGLHLDRGQQLHRLLRVTPLDLLQELGQIPHPEAPDRLPKMWRRCWHASEAPASTWNPGSQGWMCAPSAATGREAIASTSCRSPQEDLTHCSRRGRGTRATDWDLWQYEPAWSEVGGACCQRLISASTYMTNADVWMGQTVELSQVIELHI